MILKAQSGAAQPSDAAAVSLGSRSRSTTASRTRNRRDHSGSSHSAGIPQHQQPPLSLFPAATAGFATTKGDIPEELISFIPEKLQKAAKFKKGYFLPQAAAIKNSVSIPIISVGGMRRRAMMEQALLRGQADLIALCRPFIRQPNLVMQMEKSPDADPINCISCNRCTVEVVVGYKPVRCYYTSNKP